MKLDIYSGRMVKSEGKKQQPVLYIIALIILILVAITFAYLYTQELSAHSQLQQAYNTLQLNATQLKGHISILQLQLASNKTLLSAISAELNTTEYNLTHPLIQTLYDNKAINIPPETVYYYPNGTYTYVPGQYNFSINVPYSGYINITETNTGLNNNATTGYFAIYVTQEEPVMGGFGVPPNEFGITSFYSPYIKTVPTNGATVTIPVLNGTTYILFQNFNYNTGITVTFSIKYVGFRTH
jgi:archaellum component FlaF (FlaF/FlaG flagellin family)